MNSKLEINAGHFKVKAPIKVYAIILAAFMVVSVAFFTMVKYKLTYWCREVSEFAGSAAGTAVGSYDGYIDGREDGIKAGEDAGLSADDTTVNLQEAVTSAGKLEVLAAGVSLKNINEIGEAYKGLYIANGDAIFTVDLRIAEVLFSEDGSKVNITIPRPELQVFLDQNSTRKLAEKQEFSFTVKAKDGLTAYLNSMNQSMNRVSETIANYDALKELAEQSAKTQVTQMVSAMAPQGISINVEFEK